MNDIDFVLRKVFEKIDIPYTETYLTKYITKHPSPTSLLCISDVLDHYGIENNAGEFEDKTELKDYPGAHISQLLNSKSENYFVLVLDFNDTSIRYLSADRNGVIIESLEEYFLKWTGIALYFKKTKYSQEPDIKINQQKEIYIRNKWIGYGALSLFFLSLYFIKFKPLLYDLLIIATKLIGIAISVLLLLKYYMPEVKWANKLCSIGNNRGGCDEILFSKSAQVSSFLSWAEIGLFYFMTTFILALWYGGTHETGIDNTLSLLNILCLPYSFWSIYHQRIVAKNLCVLCLIIQLLFWIEFICRLTLNCKYSFVVSTTDILGLLLIAIMVIAIWYLIKPLIRQYSQYIEIETLRYRFSNDHSIFQFINKSIPETPYPNAPEFISHGISDAPIRIAIASSPACPGCKRALKLLYKLFQRYPDRIYLTEIYAIPMDIDSEKYTIANHILQYRYENTPEKFQEAISKWYESEGDYETWRKLFKVKNENIESNHSIIDFHNYTCSQLGIVATPTIFINNKKLSDKYIVDDIETIILGLEIEN